MSTFFLSRASPWPLLAPVSLTAAKAGCADGTREGFADTKLFAAIAACGGAWDQPGIFNMPVKCNREAGNDGKNAPGIGCTVSDLCAQGWHVCYGKDDVVYLPDKVRAGGPSAGRVSQGRGPFTEGRGLFSWRA